MARTSEETTFITLTFPSSTHLQFACMSVKDGEQELSFHVDEVLSKTLQDIPVDYNILNVVLMLPVSVSSISVSLLSDASVILPEPRGKL